jgi:hypothetical protein
VSDTRFSTAARASLTGARSTVQGIAKIRNADDRANRRRIAVTMLRPARLRRRYV